MKNLTDMFEKLRVDDISDADDYDLIKQELPKLKKSLESKYKIPIALNIDLYRDKNKVKITSDNVMPHIKDTLINIMLKELSFDFWGGNYIEEDRCFVFFIHLDYVLNSGGSNGVEIPKNRIVFNCIKKEWEIE